MIMCGQLRDNKNETMTQNIIIYACFNVISFSMFKSFIVLFFKCLLCVNKNVIIIMVHLHTKCINTNENYYRY